MTAQDSYGLSDAMSQTLKEFSSKRLGELDALERDIKAQLVAIANEQEAIKTALSILGENKGQISYSSNNAPQLIDASNLEFKDERPRRARMRNSAVQSMKTTIVDILNDNQMGLTATAILPLVNDRLSTNYARTSLSPQLSRLKADGVVQQNGNVWMLVKESIPMSSLKWETEARVDDNPPQTPPENSNQV